MKSTFLSCILAAAFCCICSGASPADTIDPKAKAIYDASIAAAKKVTSFDAVAEVKMTLPANEIRPAYLDRPAHLVMTFDSEDGSSMKFRIEALKDGKPTRVITNDDKTTVVVDLATKEYMDLGNTIDPILAEVLQQFPHWIMEQKRSSDEDEHSPKPVSITLDPEETLDGTPCDVVRIARKMNLILMEGGPAGEANPDPQPSIRMVTTIAIARTDSMPRRLTETVSKDDGTLVGPPPTTTLYSKVKVNAPIDSTLFTQKIPEGFAKAAIPKQEENDAKQGRMVLKDGEPMPKGTTVTRSEPRRNGLAIQVGDKAPDFQLKALDGSDVTLASLKGKVVLLDFWATWCGPCKQVMPTIQKLADEFKDKGVVVMGVNTFERGDGAAKKYIDSKKYTYGCLLKGDELAKAYGINAIPTLIIIHKDGTIAKAEVGVSGNPEKDLRDAITQALSK